MSTAYRRSATKKEATDRQLLQIRVPEHLMKLVRERAEERGLAVSVWANTVIEESASRPFIEGWAIDDSSKVDLSRAALYAERREAHPNIRLVPSFITATSLVAEVFVLGESKKWQGPITADAAREYPPFSGETLEEGVLYLPHSGFWRPMQFIEVTTALKGKHALAVFRYESRYPEKRA
jgi:hypothetical protein